MKMKLKMEINSWYRLKVNSKAFTIPIFSLLSYQTLYIVRSLSNKIGAKWIKVPNFINQVHLVS